MQNAGKAANKLRIITFPRLFSLMAFAIRIAAEIGDHDWAGIDIFRLDGKGKIVEQKSAPIKLIMVN
jgi:hypothetical protein